MENKEIPELKKLKNKLLKEARHLLYNLNKEESNITQESIIQSTSENEEPDEYDDRLCNASRGVSGITFQNVEKKWLHHDVYYYSAEVLFKFIKIFVEVKVNLKNFSDFEFCDITCDFTSVDECYLLEMRPWALQIARTRNFSLLISALSQYSKLYKIRLKCLYRIIENEYGIIEKCTHGNGGLLILLQSPKIKTIFLKIQWSLLFLKKSWHVNHFFIIKHTEIGAQFAVENERLLRSFCKTNLSKECLWNLWKELCNALNDYKETKCDV